MDTMIHRAKPLLPGLLGFLSVYLVWTAWALGFNWPSRLSYTSFAFWIGDLGLLPFYNALACTALWRGRRGIPHEAIVYSWLAIPSGVIPLMLAFEPDSNYLLHHSGIFYESTVPEAILWLHLAFICLQTSFIVFMSVVYPFCKHTWTPFWRMVGLYFLVALFAVLLFWVDNTSMYEWFKMLCILLIAILCGVFMLHSQKHRIQELRAKIPRPMTAPATT